MLGLAFTAEIRAKMLEELTHDVARGALYISPRLTSSGAAAFEQLLREALSRGDDGTLADALRSLRFLKAREMSHRNGRAYEKAVPTNAAETLAEGEVGHYHARAVCRLAIERGPGYVEVYRAKEVAVARERSIQLENRAMDAKQLLDDLRNAARTGAASALGVPGGPNSGINVRLPPH